MKTVITYLKKEIVLGIAIILAVLSVFFVRPDSQYLSYIDFRTLAILFCLMTIVAGFKELGFFDLLAEKLLTAAKSLRAAILLSGFTENVQGLIVGTNLGGLGTLIASMASLISFKYVSEESGQEKGTYLRLFTVANLLFLAVLLGLAGVLQQF